MYPCPQWRTKYIHNKIKCKLSSYVKCRVRRTNRSLNLSSNRRLRKEQLYALSNRQILFMTWTWTHRNSASILGTLHPSFPRTYEQTNVTRSIAVYYKTRTRTVNETTYTHEVLLRLQISANVISKHSKHRLPPQPIRATCWLLFCVTVKENNWNVNRGFCNGTQ